MKTIVTLVAEKTGISESQATIAVDTVVAFLKSRLPEPIASQIDGLLENDVSDMSDQVDTLLSGTGLGGLLGGK